MNDFTKEYVDKVKQSISEREDIYSCFPNEIVNECGLEVAVKNRPEIYCKYSPHHIADETIRMFVKKRKDRYEISKKIRYCMIYALDEGKINYYDFDNEYISDLETNKLPIVMCRYGFTEHPYPNVYLTASEEHGIKSVMSLQMALQENLPEFCYCLLKMHLFRFTDWEDVADIIRIV